MVRLKDLVGESIYAMIKDEVDDLGVALLRVLLRRAEQPESNRGREVDSPQTY